jgi:hypothetical protein
MAITDLWAKIKPSRTDAPENAEAIVLDTAFTNISRAIWITVAGDINVTLKSGTVITYPAVPVGRWVIAASQVNTAGTVGTAGLAEW